MMLIELGSIRVCVGSGKHLGLMRAGGWSLYIDGCVCLLPG